MAGMYTCTCIFPSKFKGLKYILNNLNMFFFHFVVSLVINIGSTVSSGQ